MITVMGIIPERDAGADQLLQLMTLFSPVFPTGSFSYSHGLEQAVHDGFISSRHELESWLRGLLQKGTLWNDVVFLTEAWQSMKKGGDITGLAQLACAMAGSREREMETCMQGQAFLQASADFGFLLPMKPAKPAYPVVAGAVAVMAGIELVPAAAAYMHAFLSGLVQAGLRLVRIGQTDGVRLMRALQHDILDLSRKIPHLTLADLGSATVMSEICSLRHETLYSRIFRS